MVLRLCHWYGTQGVLLVLCYQSGAEVCASGVLCRWCGIKVVGLMCKYGSANGIKLKTSTDTQQCLQLVASKQNVSCLTSVHGTAELYYTPFVSNNTHFCYFVYRYCVY